MLHVLEALEGGTARHLVDLVRHTQGFEHHVAIPDQRTGWITDPVAARDIVAAGGVRHVIDMRRSPLHARNALAVVSIRSLVARLRPAIVHGHSAVGGALSRIASSVHRVPRIYTPNGLPRERVAVACERVLARLTSRLVAVSPSERQEMLALRLLPVERIRVIPNGIDLDVPASTVDLRARLGLESGTPLVGTVARSVPQKAPLDFVRIAERVGARRPDVHFLHVGAGPLDRDIDDAAACAQLGSRYHRLAFLPDAGRLLGQLDVYVLASAFEGGPYTPLEAMRGGAPVVVSDVVGNRDVVQHEHTGLIVTPGDTSAFASAIVRLLDEPEQCRWLVDNARAELRARFDVRRAGEQMAALYHEVIAEQRR